MNNFDSTAIACYFAFFVHDTYISIFVACDGSAYAELFLCFALIVIFDARICFM